MNGMQVGFGFQGTEDRPDAGQGHAGAPQGGLVPIDQVGAQAADVRMGRHRALQRASGEADGDDMPPGRVGVDRDVVVPGESPAPGLGPPDAFPDPFDPFPDAREEGLE